MRGREGREGWLALVAQANQQYGVITWQQAAAALTRNEFDGYVRRNVLVPAARGVWRMSGASRTWRGRVMTACLSIGRPVAASHTTAARLWGIEGLPATGMHLVVPRGRSGRLGDSLSSTGVVRHAAELPETSVVERYGLPTTTPARTLVDLAGMLDPERLFAVAEQLERDRHFDLEALHKERLARPRLKGIRAVDQLLARWSGDSGGPVADSKWEDEVLRWLTEGGLPIPRRQHQVILGDGRLVLIDLAYPPEQIAIEFDGFRYHRGREQFDRDRDRLSELAADGWLPILVTASQSRDDVVGRVRRALERMGWHPSRPLDTTEKSR